MADITGASLRSFTKYFQLEKADGTMEDLSAYVLDANWTLPTNTEDDSAGNEFYESPLVVSGGQRTLSLTMRYTTEIDQIIEDLLAAQASTTAIKHWAYVYGPDTNTTGKRKVSGFGVVTNWTPSAPHHGKQNATLDFGVRTRIVGTF